MRIDAVSWTMSISYKDFECFEAYDVLVHDFFVENHYNFKHFKLCKNMSDSDFRDI